MLPVFIDKLQAVPDWAGRIGGLVVRGVVQPGGRTARLYRRRPGCLQDHTHRLTKCPKTANVRDVEPERNSLTTRPLNSSHRLSRCIGMVVIREDDARAAPRNVLRSTGTNPMAATPGIECLHWLQSGHAFAAFTLRADTPT